MPAVVNDSEGKDGQHKTNSTGFVRECLWFCVGIFCLTGFLLGFFFYILIFCFLLFWFAGFGEKEQEVEKGERWEIRVRGRERI